MTDTQTTQGTDIDVTAAPVEADAPVSDDTAAEADDNAAEGDEAPSDDIEGELKTVRKALEKRNRYNNNLRQRIRALEAEVEKTKSEFGGKKSDAPSLDKFDSVLDFVDAKQNYTLEQKLAEQAHQAQIAALEQQQQMALAQQAQEVGAQVTELLNSNPDFKSVITSNAQVINAMPPHIEKMMAEIDDAPAATYALAKEGRLQSLYSMPPQLAAAHLVQAEIRGQQLLQKAAPKPQSQPAPKPIGSLKGSGKSGKDMSDMSPDELVKHINAISR